MLVIYLNYRGVSSVVRKCLHRVSGGEFAVKIIDKLSDQGGVDIIDTTKDEVDILLTVHGHQSISKYYMVWTC